MQRARKLAKNVPVNTKNQNILRDGYNGHEGRVQYGRDPQDWRNLNKLDAESAGYTYLKEQEAHLKKKGPNKGDSREFVAVTAALQTVVEDANEDSLTTLNDACCAYLEAKVKSHFSRWTTHGELRMDWVYFIYTVTQTKLAELEQRQNERNLENDINPNHVPNDNELLQLEDSQQNNINQVNDDQIQQLTQQNEQLQNENNEKDKEINKLKARVQELENNDQLKQPPQQTPLVQNQHKEVEQKDPEINQLNEQIQELNREKFQLTRQLLQQLLQQDLLQKIRQKDDKINELKEQNTQLNARVQQLENENKHLKESPQQSAPVQNQHKKVEQKDNKIKQLNEQNKQKDTEIKQLKKQNENLTKKYNEKDKQIQQKDNEIKQLNEQIKKVHASVNKFYELTSDEKEFSRKEIVHIWADMENLLEYLENAEEEFEEEFEKESDIGLKGTVEFLRTTGYQRPQPPKNGERLQGVKEQVTPAEIEQLKIEFKRIDEDARSVMTNALKQFQQKKQLIEAYDNRIKEMETEYNQKIQFLVDKYNDLIDEAENELYKRKLNIEEPKDDEIKLLNKEIEKLKGEIAKVSIQENKDLNAKNIEIDILTKKLDAEKKMNYTLIVNLYLKINGMDWMGYHFKTTEDKEVIFITEDYYNSNLKETIEEKQKILAENTTSTAAGSESDKYVSIELPYIEGCGSAYLSHSVKMKGYYIDVTTESTNSFSLGEGHLPGFKNNVKRELRITKDRDAIQQALKFYDYHLLDEFVDDKNNAVRIVREEFERELKEQQQQAEEKLKQQKEDFEKQLAQAQSNTAGSQGDEGNGSAQVWKIPWGYWQQGKVSFPNGTVVSLKVDDKFKGEITINDVFKFPEDLGLQVKGADLYQILNFPKAYAGNQTQFSFNLPTGEETFGKLTVTLEEGYTKDLGEYGLCKESGGRGNYYVVVHLED